MSTQISSLVGGGVKRVIRGKYLGKVRSGGVITIPEVNPEKTTVKLLSSVYHSFQSADTGGYGGVIDSVYVELKDSETLFVMNRMDMWVRSTANMWVNYVPVSWEVIEYA